MPCTYRNWYLVYHIYFINLCGPGWKNTSFCRRHFPCWVSALQFCHSNSTSNSNSNSHSWIKCKLKFFSSEFCTTLVHKKVFWQGFLINVFLFHFSWNLLPNSTNHTYNIIKIQFKGLIRWHGTLIPSPRLFLVQKHLLLLRKTSRSTLQNSMQTALTPSLALC